MIKYGFKKTLDFSFEDAEKKIKEELKKEGFGVLTEIDLQEKFREKLGIDFERYIILGACNPPLAHKSILAEEDIGLLLPCNVILHEQNGQVAVSIIKPTVAMGMIENSELEKVAIEVESKLEKVMKNL